MLLGGKWTAQSPPVGVLCYKEKMARINESSIVSGSITKMTGFVV